MRSSSRMGLLIVSGLTANGAAKRDSGRGRSRRSCRSPGSQRARPRAAPSSCPPGWLWPAVPYMRPKAPGQQASPSQMYRLTIYRRPIYSSSHAAAGGAFREQLSCRPGSLRAAPERERRAPKARALPGLACRRRRCRALPAPSASPPGRDGRWLTAEARCRVPIPRSEDA